MTYQPKTYRKQGGDEFVVASGGKVTVESGGDIDIESGGSLKLAGVAVSASAAELNKMDGVTALTAELNNLDGPVAGTVAASKAVVVDANKAVDVIGLSAGAAAAAVAQRFGASATEGMEIKVIDETLSALAAVSTDLTEDIPDGAVLLSVQANIETACVAGSTSVKVGIGPTADPDKYGITSAFTKNLKIDTIPDWAVLSGAEDVQVNACATAGGIGDTAFSAGAVRVRIVYLVPNSLDNAA